MSGKIHGWGSNRHNVLGFASPLAAAAPPAATEASNGNKSGSGRGDDEVKSEAAHDPFADGFVQSQPLQVRGPVERATVVQLVRSITS